MNKELENASEANVPNPIIPQEEVVKNDFYKIKIRLILFAFVILLILLSLFLLVISRKTTKEETEKLSPATPTKTLFPSVSPGPTAIFVPDQLIIKYKENNSPQDLSTERKVQIEKIFNEMGVLSEEELYSSSSGALANYYVLKFKKGTNLDQVKKILNSIPEIENAEQNHIITTDN